MQDYSGEMRGVLGESQYGMGKRSMVKGNYDRVNREGLYINQ